MNVIEARDGFVNRVADDHATTACSVRVVERNLRVGGIAPAFSRPVGWRTPKEANRRALAALGGTASGITRTDGALDVEEDASGNVDRGARVDDQLGTLSHLNVSIEGVGARPGFGAHHDAALGLVVCGNRRDRHHAHHQGQEEEGHEGNAAQGSGSRHGIHHALLIRTTYNAVGRFAPGFVSKMT